MLFVIIVAAVVAIVVAAVPVYFVSEECNFGYFGFISILKLLLINKPPVFKFFATPSHIFLTSSGLSA